MKNISQPDIVLGILGVLTKLGVKFAEPRIVNVCIAAADKILAEINREPRMATDAMGLGAWLACDDRGMSSDYMAHVLAGGPKCEPAYPHDSSDFGRCSRFLRAVPTARKHLPKMATCGAVWAEYVKQWSVMEGYLASESTTGKCPKLNAMMHDIQDAARKAAP